MSKIFPHYPAWIVSVYMPQKDGSIVAETQIVRSLTVPKGGKRLEAVPLRYGEKAINGEIVRDEEAIAAHEEEARLNRMSLSERQAEAIAKARSAIVNQLEAAGVIEPAKAAALRNGEAADARD